MKKADLSHLQWGWYLISNWSCTFWHLLYNTGEDEGQREGRLLMLNDHILTTWHCCAWGGAELWTHHWHCQAWTAFWPPKNCQQCDGTIILLHTRFSQVANDSAPSPQMIANASMLLWDATKAQTGRELWESFCSDTLSFTLYPNAGWGKHLHTSFRTRRPAAL